MAKVNILLVDDQPANLLALEAVLEGLGENLVKAHSGAEALRRVDQECAVILLDVQMDGLDGFETAKLIRSREQTRSTPIIFLTAYEDNGLSVEKAYALGAVDYLVKPIVPVILRAKVAGFVELFKKTQQVRQQAAMLRELEQREFDRRLAEENARLQQQKEQALRENERHFREMMDALPAAIYTTDAEGRLTYFNPAAVELSGRVPELGTDRWCVSWKLYQPDGTPLPHDQCPMVIALRENHFLRGAEIIAERPDGKRVWLTPYPAPLHDADGRVIGGVNMLVDITERKKAEELLRQSEQRLASLVDSSNDAIVTKSLDGIIQSWNASAERLFGYTAAEAVGSSIFLIIPADRADEERRIIAQLKAGERIEHFDTERVRKDGQIVQVSLTISPIKDATGKVVAASKIARDITKQKQLEADLREADRRKTEFLAMLAHELRNPLAPIRNALKILRLTTSPRHDSADDEAVRAASEMMERQVSQMVRMVDDLLDISRISRGKIQLRRSRVELASAVDHAVEAARALVESRKHELTVVLPPQPIYLNADSTRLAQVLGNLLSNSCKFTNKGGRIWLTVERAGPEAVIRVRDTGIGIAADQLPHVFDMFTQVDTSLERAVSGLGIGLALVKTLVELHGGTVEAHSDGVGQGSEFVVRLPVLADAPEPLREAKAHRPIATTGRRILVVDDNQDSARSLAMLLRLTGNETHMSYDGLEAVEAAARFRPDVILMDIGLPKLNGYEAARRIRQQPWNRHAALIALTGWGQEEDRQRSRAAGFNSHLVKPVDLDDLMKVLATWQPVAAE
jgi:PAS domain S-box-containing protein